MAEKLKVISRYSPLAKIQVDEVFRNFPTLDYELTDVKTLGDKDKKTSLIDNPVADFFTREIDEALLNGSADVAVHSAKDLPFPLPVGLKIVALTQANDTTDCIVSKGNATLAELPANAKIGTSSKARQAQILELKPDAEIIPIRGTIEERIQAIEDGTIDALIVATCAIKRLELDQKISQILPFKAHPLQGHLAIVAKVEHVKLATRFSSIDIRKQFGKVTMVGFGPSDSEYLTVKGMKALNKADAIFYDDLIDKHLLSKFNCEKIYVGKRKGNHSKDQTEICELLYQAAIAGKQTVRLKGGDPAVFGRLGEELDYLRERLINVEVVPGITTASAAAALSGISLTQRGLSKSVVFVTGHTADVHVPDAETIVFYMGATNFYKISARLIEKGWDENTQVAIISNVSRPDQKTQIDTLASFTKEKEVITPAIIIVSKVVNKALIESYIYSDPKVLVTGTKAGNYSEYGKVVHTPLISIEPLPINKKVFKNIEDYNYIVFTSIYTVHYFFKYLIQSGKDIRALRKVKIVSVGKTTSKKLKKHGLIPDFEPKDQSSYGIIKLFKKHGISDAKILIPRSNLGLPILPEGLEKLGNSVKIYKIYKNELPEFYSKVDLNDFKYLVFSSPSCIDNFKKVYKNLPEHIIPITKGKVTEARLKQVFPG